MGMCDSSTLCLANVMATSSTMTLREGMGVALYPPGYYYNESVQHKDASMNREMYQIHDQHSLAVIIGLHFIDELSVTIQTKLRSHEPLSNILDLIPPVSEP